MSAQRYHTMPSVTPLHPRPYSWPLPPCFRTQKLYDYSRNSRGHVLAGWHVPAGLWPGWDLLCRDNINHVHTELFCTVDLVKLCFKQLRISQKPANLLASNNIFSRGCSPRFPGLSPYYHIFECLAPLLSVTQKDLSNDHFHAQRRQVHAQYSL